MVTLKDVDDLVSKLNSLTVPLAKERPLSAIERLREQLDETISERGSRLRTMAPWIFRQNPRAMAQPILFIRSDKGTVRSPFQPYPEFAIKVDKNGRAIIKKPARSSLPGYAREYYQLNKEVISEKRRKKKLEKQASLDHFRSMSAITKLNETDEPSTITIAQTDQTATLR